MSPILQTDARVTCPRSLDRSVAANPVLQASASALCLQPELGLHCWAHCELPPLFCWAGSSSCWLAATEERAGQGHKEQPGAFWTQLGSGDSTGALQVRPAAVTVRVWQRSAAWGRAPSPPRAGGFDSQKESLGGGATAKNHHDWSVTPQHATKPRCPVLWPLVRGLDGWCHMGVGLKAERCQHLDNRGPILRSSGLIPLPLAFLPFTQL